MEIERHDNRIIFTFEPRDWKRRDVRAFLTEIKTQIPSASRHYDDESGRWTISGGHTQTFDQIYEQHFRDQNQPELF